MRRPRRTGARAAGADARCNSLSSPDGFSTVLCKYTHARRGVLCPRWLSPFRDATVFDAAGEGDVGAGVPGRVPLGATGCHLVSLGITWCSRRAFQEGGGEGAEERRGRLRALSRGPPKVVIYSLHKPYLCSRNIGHPLPRSSELLWLARSVVYQWYIV